MSAYQQAIEIAIKSGRDMFVNRYQVGPYEEYMIVETGKRPLCCAVAHPDGTLEYIVQGYSHAVARTQRSTDK